MERTLFVLIEIEQQFKSDILLPKHHSNRAAERLSANGSVNAIAIAIDNETLPVLCSLPSPSQTELKSGKDEQDLYNDVSFPLQAKDAAEV